MRSAARTGHVVTVEDHSDPRRPRRRGGRAARRGDADARSSASGVHGFGESGDLKGLYAKHGLDAAGIAAAVRKFLAR